MRIAAVTLTESHRIAYVVDTTIIGCQHKVGTLAAVLNILELILKLT